MSVYTENIMLRIAPNTKESLERYAEELGTTFIGNAARKIIMDWEKGYSNHSSVKKEIGDKKEMLQSVTKTNTKKVVKKVKPKEPEPIEEEEEEYEEIEKPETVRCIYCGKIKIEKYVESADEFFSVKKNVIYWECPKCGNPSKWRQKNKYPKFRDNLLS